MKGYWNRPEATEESIKDGWFYSGDIGYFDDEGFLYIHDRVKDMIVSGGENIYPAEVENALMSHAEILDAAVIAVPDEKWGEVPCAFIEMVQDKPITEKELIDFCKETLAGFKVPKKVIFCFLQPQGNTFYL